MTYLAAASSFGSPRTVPYSSQRTCLDYTSKNQKFGTNDELQDQSRPVTMPSKPQNQYADDLFAASCYLEGPSPLQNAHLILLPDQTVHAIVNEGGIAGIDGVVSVRQAAKLRSRLLKQKWTMVSVPRRATEKIRADMRAACCSFLAQPMGRPERYPDPDANVVPPEATTRRQRERLASGGPSAVTQIVRGSGFEKNRRRH